MSDPVLMSWANPQGWKLEDLCLKLSEEIKERDVHLSGLSEDKIPTAAAMVYHMVNQHNLVLLGRLHAMQSAAIEFRTNIDTMDHAEAHAIFCRRVEEYEKSLRN